MKLTKILVGGVFLASNVFAATSGTLLLTGFIPKQVSIVVTPLAAASNLNLEVSQTSLNVGSLTGSSNSGAGYRISVASTNLGKLVHTSTPTSFVPYTLKIDTSTYNLGTGSFIDFTGIGNFTAKQISISYTGVDGNLFKDGSYTDSIVFSISAN